MEDIVCKNAPSLKEVKRVLHVISTLLMTGTSRISTRSHTRRPVLHGKDLHLEAEMDTDSLLGMLISLAGQTFACANQPD